LKASAVFCGSLTFSLFIRTGGIYSICCTFPNLCFTMF
jgi:hypothetical protein